MQKRRALSQAKEMWSMVSLDFMGPRESEDVHVGRRG